MRIAVEACTHGELESVYNAVIESEKTDGKKVDLLICCGDFLAVRNLRDLQCITASDDDKPKEIGTFYKYYTGEKVAPVLTLFIGGNHEVSNYLQEFPYGGWMAPNIYYLGYAGVVTVAGIRIAGMSGIYSSRDYVKGHYEFPPYNNNTMQSANHIQNLDVFRLKKLSGRIDVMVSHDWPLGITKYGNVDALLRQEPLLRKDIENDTLGNPPAMEILKLHYPTHWFAAHLHSKFSAFVLNEDNSRATNFLALGKCSHRRKYLQIIDIEHDQSLPIKLSYDLEWLTILSLTNHLLNIKSSLNYLPEPHYQYIPSKEEKERVHQKFNSDLSVPLNFKETLDHYGPENLCTRVDQPNLVVNHQTAEFCKKLAIDDPSALIKRTTSRSENINKQSSKSFINLRLFGRIESIEVSLSPNIKDEYEQSIERYDKKSQFISIAIAKNNSRSNGVTRFVADKVPTYNSRSDEKPRFITVNGPKLNSRTVMSLLKLPACVAHHKRTRKLEDLNGNVETNTKKISLSK